MDDLYLINQVKQTGDSEAFSKLSACHSGVYLKVLDESLPDSFHRQKEDFREEKEFFLYDAVMKYDPNKGMKFSTYLGQTIKWKCMSLKSRGPEKDTVEYETYRNTLPEPEYVQEIDKSRIETIFQYAEDFSDPVARNVIQLRFNDGRKVMTWEKIAKTLDITPREANLAYQRFVKKAKKDLL